jgi:signal transduction histidine kinase
MSQPSAPQLFAAALYLFTTLVWSVIAADLWQFRLRLRPRNPMSRLLPWLCSAVAGLFASALIFALVPAETHALRPWPLVALYTFQDAIIVVAIALTRHLALLMPTGVSRPTRRWLVGNYSLAAAIVALTVAPIPFMAAMPVSAVAVIRTIHFGYIVIMLGLTVAHVARFARRGLWSPGSLGDMRTADVVALTVGILVAVVLFSALVSVGEYSWVRPTWVVILNTALGLTLAVPFAVRVLGLLVRELSVMGVNLLVASGVYALVTALGARYGSAPGSVFQLVGVFAPILLLIPAQAPLRRVVSDWFFRRRHQRQAELHSALLHLSPELGIAECCRLGMEEFVRIMGLRGAGILLDADGTAIVAGAMDLAPLQRVWPRGAAAAALPTAVFAGGLMRELPLPLQQALIDAEVVGVTPIVSPRRRWGCGFITTDVLRASFTPEEIEAVQALAGQFALVLDAAELLERAVTVERSLAHSEKLAAVGELAARVAHEIRNPVTAARSLAQLMMSDPTSPHAAEHCELILAELGRVERQVQALLRFARREDFSFAAVDVGDLARAALEPLRARLEAGGVSVETAIAPGVVARADADKLRQVVLNLLDNAADAVAGSADKRVTLSVRGLNGMAVLEVGDSGPGVPDDALPRLFEPFFSLKTTGTGLGLAIVKRTVEAHGGRVEALTLAGAGLSLRVELPSEGSKGPRGRGSEQDFGRGPSKLGPSTVNPRTPSE